jgi:hypothetical protein
MQKRLENEFRFGEIKDAGLSDIDEVEMKEYLAELRKDDRDKPDYLKDPNYTKSMHGNHLRITLMDTLLMLVASFVVQNGEHRLLSILKQIKFIVSNCYISSIVIVIESQRLYWNHVEHYWKHRIRHDLNLLSVLSISY